MPSFTVEHASALPGPEWLRRQRIAAMERFGARELPTPAEEIWRYSRIDELDLDRFSALTVPSSTTWLPEETGWVGRVAATATTVDGWVREVQVGAAGRDAGVAFPFPDSGADRVGVLSASVSPWDAFVELNTALCPGPLVVEVGPGAIVDDPIVISHGIGTEAAAVFPRTVIALGNGARATVIEVLSSSDVLALVAPVVEVQVGEDAELHHVVVQQLGSRVWETACHTSRIAAHGTLHSFAIALGGDYARVRTDSTLAGEGGSAELLALYFGDGSQMHDFRTLQQHEGAKTTSDLVFKGAVVGSARSSYSGVIRVQHGATGTKAFQTNRNLILSDAGFATNSVPNLEIEERDVSCSHASATGPIDEDQLFYLESRGVPTPVAEQLVVTGFFDDLLGRLTVEPVRVALRQAIRTKLASR